jgi:FeS assembly SUF system protein
MSIRIFDTGGEDRRVAPSQTPEAGTLRGRIIDAIKTVYDPEIPVNLYDLGLIYEIDIGDGGDDTDGAVAVGIKMTLTSPACPEAHTLPELVRKAALGVDGVRDVIVEMVWEPRWSRDMMCDEAKLHLGLM